MGCCFQQKTCNTSETGHDRTKVNYYWWLIGSRTRAFDAKNQRLWMTLKGQYALCFKIHSLLEPITKIWITIDLHYQRRRCSPMTLVSGNISFMRIFAGFPRKGASKDSGVVEKWQFSILSLAISSESLEVISQHYCIVLFSPLLPFQWPHNVTLNDPEWPFYVKFFFLSIQVQNLLIYLHGQCNYVHGERNHLHLCLLEVCNVFQRTQAYCLNVQYN